MLSLPCVCRCFSCVSSSLCTPVSLGRFEYSQMTLTHTFQLYVLKFKISFLLALDEQRFVENVLKESAQGLEVKARPAGRTAEMW